MFIGSKTEQIINRTIPSYIKRDHPIFVEFVRTYLNWLESEENTLNVSANFLNYHDVDNTIESLVRYFEYELIPTLPADMPVDKALLIKNIKSFYTIKGTESSYRFLFRFLFQEDIDFYYPKVDILRASDGKWFEPKSIKISKTQITDIYSIINKEVVGLTSGAVALIEDAIEYFDRDETIIELTLSNIISSFQYEENVQIIIDDTLTAVETILPVIGAVTIINGGTGYSVGDSFSVKDATGTIISYGEVALAGSGGISALTIDNGGFLYNGNQTSVENFLYLPVDYTWNNMDLLNTQLYPADSNSYDFLNLQINALIAEELISNTGDIIQISPTGGSSGSGAGGVVSKVDQYGTILEVILTSFGQNYQSASAAVISNTGHDADISITAVGGSIIKAKLDSFPIIKYTDYDSNNDLTIYPDFNSSGDANASGIISVGTLIEYKGRYINDDGHLSSTKKLQDNFFYQDFSYVIKSGLSINSWGDIVSRIAHPAGLKLFGEVQFVSLIETQTEISDIIVQQTDIDSNG